MSYLNNIQLSAILSSQTKSFGCMIKSDRREISKTKKEAKHSVIVQINCTLTYTTTTDSYNNIKFDILFQAYHTPGILIKNGEVVKDITFLQKFLYIYRRYRCLFWIVRDKRIRYMLRYQAQHMVFVEEIITTRKSN